MLHTVRPYLLCLLLAGLFTWLFHDTGIGLNLLLFEAAAFTLLFMMRPVTLTREVRLAVGGVFATATAVVLHGSALAITMNLFFAVVAVGVLLAPELSALHHSLVLSLSHVFAAQRAFIRSLPWPASVSPTLGITPRGAITTGLVPLVILLFVTIYRASNPYFDDLMERFWARFAHLDITVPLLFVWGTAIGAFVLFATRNERLLRFFGSRTDALPEPGDQLDGAGRQRLRGEMRTGIVLLGMLNVLLLLANVLDIQHVWIDFRFQGQYLKQFVHQGTYLLIISIILGALIVLYYFRGDLNFHRHNRVIRLLSYAWLVQNLVLALSVAMRNYRYIHHYALAYKRIGVAFFLIAVCIMLVLVILKVRDRRSMHFLSRWSALAVYGSALLMAVFDWDTIIARYNMAQRERAFVHLDFLATLSDKALPHLTRSGPELERIDLYNQHLIGGAERYSRVLYMHPMTFRQVIRERTADFLAEYPTRSWREWDLADARAYQALKAARE
jgi:hypothetical protein